MSFPATVMISGDSRDIVTANMADVIATFHEHDIRPLYFRITDEEGLRHEYKVERILSHKEQKTYGIGTIKYICEYKITDGIMRQIGLIYNIAEHAWTIERQP